MPAPAFGVNSTSGDPVRVYIDGEFHWWDDLTPEEQAEWIREHPERYEQEQTASKPTSKLVKQQAAAEDLGLPTNPQGDLRSMLEQAGVDVEAPEVQLYIQTTQAAVDAGSLDTNLVALQAQALAEKYPSTPVTAYTDALAASGFGDEPYPAPRTVPVGGAPQLRTEIGMQQVPVPGQPRFQEQEETGWIRYANGVLVPAGAPLGTTPGAVSVIYDPASKAPGSGAWQREVVSQWGPDKVAEWRKRLIEFGYLPKEAKKGGADATFMNALALYHNNRYINGGKPIAVDASASAGGADRPKLVNLEDFQAQIRNDVREQYQRVYGIRPTDGEVQQWSDYIIRQGMDLQRKFRRKYDSPMTDTAATEAEERFIEKIESTPQAQFLRESEEENTRLRDTFERMAQVTASLAS